MVVVCCVLVARSSLCEACLSFAVCCLLGGGCLFVVCCLLFAW